MRLDDWPERLSEVLEASRSRAFRLGEHDCCLHVADCIAAVTGRDLAADWRGRYATEAEGLALAAVKRLTALADRFFAPVPPALAWRGDVALAPVGVPVRGRRTPMLLVVDGKWLRGPGGAVAERRLAVRAWRVE